MITKKWGDIVAEQSVQAETTVDHESSSKAKELWHQLKKSKTGLFGLIITLVVVFIAIFAPFIATHDPLATDTTLMNKPPFWLEGGDKENILGTDNLGRDIFSRVIYGSRVSLLVGFFAVIIAGIIGVMIGLLSGFYGGFIDNMLMRLVDAFLAIPGILLVLVFLAVLKPGLMTLIFIIGITTWTTYARVIRGEVLAVKELEFVKAALTIGVSRPVIIIRHILPNVFTPFIVISTLSVATTIILEASLSFLGMGIQSPAISWGGMLSDGRDYLTTSWWIATFPGAALTITVLGIILLGDWLRDALDPRLSNKG